MLLQVDNRLAGSPRYFLTREWQNLMRLHPDSLQTVAFIHRRWSMAEAPKTTGTVFFVSYGDEGARTALFYAITAKHVIEKCRDDSQDGKILLRTNFRDGKAEFIETDLADWRFHPTDETVDVAVLPLRYRDPDFFKSLDIKAFPMKKEGIASPEIIAREGIGPGDEVYIVGLFRNRPGKLRNIPIARIGNIAAMPGEPVNCRRWHDRDIEAYLIEAKSIGGLSGSPVFVTLGPIRITRPTNSPGTVPPTANVNVPGATYLGQAPIHVFADRSGPAFLLGLVHGHFDLHLPDTDAETDTDHRVAINSGIAIVVPVTKIKEVLDQPELVALRAQLDAVGRRQESATPD